MNFLLLNIVPKRRFEFQSLMGPYLVMVILIPGQLLVMFFEVERFVLEFVKLFS